MWASKARPQFVVLKWWILRNVKKADWLKLPLNLLWKEFLHFSRWCSNVFYVRRANYCAQASSESCISKFIMRASDVLSEQRDQGRLKLAQR